MSGVSASRFLRHGHTQPAADFDVFTNGCTARVECRGFVAIRVTQWLPSFRTYMQRWELYLVEDDGVEQFVRYADGWEVEHLERAVQDAMRRVA